MVGTCNRAACRIRNRRRRHNRNIHLRKKRTPRASQHYVGWRIGQTSVLLPVVGEMFLLTLPFIERGNRPSNIDAIPLSDGPNSQGLAEPGGMVKGVVLLSFD